MTTVTMTTGIKRTQPIIKELFRNTILYNTEKTTIFQSAPRTVLLFTWLGAKEKIAQKYINSWNGHGFNVLHITTNVADLLMPKSKSEVTIQRVVNYLLNDEHKVIIHGLSVGGYLGARLIMQSNDTDLRPRITHQIYDSFMNTVGLQAGVVHAVPPNMSRIAGIIGGAYYKYADLSVFKSTEKFLSETPAAIPTYYMHSLADYVARYNWIDSFVKAQSKVSSTSVLLIPEGKKIGHVNLYRILGEKPYMSSIFKFLGRNNLNIPTEFAVHKETEELATNEKVLD